MARSPLLLGFSVGGAVVEGETLLLEESGPWIVVLTTTIPTLPLAVTSMYLGHDRCRETLVGELVDIGSGSEAPELVKRRVGFDAAAFTYERRSFLYDHLGRLQDLALDRRGASLQVLGSEGAARAFDPLAAR